MPYEELTPLHHWHGQHGSKGFPTGPAIGIDVMSYTGALLLYIFGGLTFLPLLLLLLLVHAYFTFPRKDSTTDNLDDPSDELRNNDDDTYSIKSGRSLHDLAEKFQRGHEPDVASGYFAVCREYVPGGVNGKPPERTTPAGSVIAAESPSVYQSMYRSLFDRKQAPTIHPKQENGKAVKRARNIFFVVLRHGHLMLYENSDQVEVKYVIAIERYDVSIYSGEGEIPEGELWIRRNAIMLSRKAGTGEDTSKPFFFFSENCSDKEDFYVALLQNQEQRPDAIDNPPRPLQFDPRLAIGLVQRLHSSEEQLQTRWLNALIGRLFLALYKTPEVEDFVRKKISKKIARAKKPAFLSDIVLRSIEMGESAPQITNPRLKDLTIDGDCCAEMDVNYRGGFRLEVATTARIDLGTRFKAREVTVILAVIVKRLKGHALVKFKPPPSNRMWLAFETMPDMDMTIEPLVSSRQITYGFILRTIEARIREVLAETLVLPHWDDVPFTDTSHQSFRGGIWTPLDSQPSQTSTQTAIPDEAPEEEVEIDADATVNMPSPRSKGERVMSMPIATATLAVNDSPEIATVSSEATISTDSVSTSAQKGPVPPKALRSRSFASAANPLLSMDNANIDSKQAGKGEKTKKPPVDATSVMRTISNKSRPSSPPETGAASTPDLPSSWENGIKSGDGSSTASHSSSEFGQGLPPPLVSESDSMVSLPSTPTSTSSQSNKISFADDSTPRSLQAEGRTATFSDKKQAVAAVNAATAAAKKWGWNVLNRNAEPKNQWSPDSNRAGTPTHPIGRGQPLPPPGQPLPLPEGQRSKTTAPLMGRRKPLPPPDLKHRSGVKQQEETKTRLVPPPPPPLPARRRQSAQMTKDSEAEDMLVVEAPADSEPVSPEKRQEGKNIESALLELGDALAPDTHAPQTMQSDENKMNHRTSQPLQAQMDTTEEDEAIAAWQDT